ncbi:putative fluoride ion transporter CrcB [Thermaurantimonas aggregans]|uniref:Fluoride-specific ion channel FluC n=1 Tax=Thermaurantimonas aggregans TaxID=2173829 RepID=A0A401XNW9_9FLAO|nr:fluoride efflux transporter CrcB [Thermaurantimonas aggregans]MCX8149560.1 fluoride efflux transporter CrcB [Thermaurantimonas aggregans]GCD78700.1 putative fluoride ion transporter CrcB [Thermaurantimonas aggregans]
METIKYALITGAGSFIGGASRYLVSVAVQLASKVGYPISTFLVNIAGSFLIGLILSAWEQDIISDTSRIFLATGIMGGFTTFSSFSQEIMLMLKAGQTGPALLYIFSSIILGLGACIFGYYLGK